jgi:hypothetical protein
MVAAASCVGCGLAVSAAVVSSVAKVLIMDFNVRRVVSGLGSRNQLRLLKIVEPRKL